MYILVVTVHVNPTDIGEFVAATQENAQRSRQEPGNVRYDVLQSEDDPTCFVLYEAYRTKADFLYHRQSTHAMRWKAQIEPWMVRPRERTRCTSVLFGDE